MSPRIEREFENAKSEWESRDDWQFADRDTERKFFFAQGAALVIQISEDYDTLFDSDVRLPPTTVEFIGKELEHEP